MTSVTALGRAKLNLVLRVGNKRPDGLHDVESLMQTVSLEDLVRVEPGDGSVSFTAGSGFLGDLPGSPDIVSRVLSEVGPEFIVAIEKNIPIAAGLAGGSADAAAAILAINEIRGRIMNAQEMMMLGAQIGSDVPFALRGGNAKVGGRGELVEAVACEIEMWWVLGISREGLSTSDVYDMHDRIGLDPASGDLSTPVTALRAGDLNQIAEALRNDLERAAFELMPSLGSRKSEMQKAGALAAVMSGSGSTIAGLCSDEAHARRIAASLTTFDKTIVVHSTMRGAEIIPDAAGQSLM